MSFMIGKHRFTRFFAHTVLDLLQFGTEGSFECFVDNGFEGETIMSHSMDSSKDYSHKGMDCTNKDSQIWTLIWTISA